MTIISMPRWADSASPRTDDEWLLRAIGLSAAAVEKGGIPFAGLVVHGGGLIGEGVNEVDALVDPTAHAEVQAIRAACRVLGTTRLAGSTLYASAEPCAMCRIAAAGAGVSRIVYAADADEAARYGFHYGRSRQLLAGAAVWDQAGAPPHVQRAIASRLEPFERSRRQRSVADRRAIDHCCDHATPPR